MNIHTKKKERKREKLPKTEETTKCVMSSNVTFALRMLRKTRYGACDYGHCCAVNTKLKEEERKAEWNLC